MYSPPSTLSADLRTLAREWVVSAGSKSLFFGAARTRHLLLFLWSFQAFRSVVVMFRAFYKIYATYRMMLRIHGKGALCYRIVDSHLE